MLKTVQLLLPALVPSWRFFDEIVPSPRIEYALVENPDQEPESWQEFRPRPDHVSIPTMMKRMLWNPRWNESLFLVSCAERLMAHPTDHSETEILNRIRRDILTSGEGIEPETHLIFRLVFLGRIDDNIERYVTFQSTPVRIGEGEPI